MQSPHKFTPRQFETAVYAMMHSNIYVFWISDTLYNLYLRMPNKVMKMDWESWDWVDTEYKTIEEITEKHPEYVWDSVANAVTNTKITAKD